MTLLALGTLDTLESATLVGELARLGVVLHRSGTTLRASAPAGTLTPELRRVIATRKAELLEHVGPWPCVACRRFAFARRDTRCFWCRTSTTGAA